MTTRGDQGPVGPLTISAESQAEFLQQDPTLRITRFVAGCRHDAPFGADALLGGCGCFA